MNKEGLNTNGISKIILCSEYFKRAKHCRIAWLNNYYKSIVDAEKVKKSFKEQCQEFAKYNGQAVETGLEKGGQE